jgi:hypothetical protein
LCRGVPALRPIAGVGTGEPPPRRPTCLFGGVSNMRRPGGIGPCRSDMITMPPLRTSAETFGIARWRCASSRCIHTAVSMTKSNFPCVLAQTNAAGADGRQKNEGVLETSAPVWANHMRRRLHKLPPPSSLAKTVLSRRCDRRGDRQKNLD